VALGATTDTLSQPNIPKGAGAPLTVSSTAIGPLP
jgi:hypothetical protein